MSGINDISWFPGHMKKALDRVKEKINISDGVIEVLDSRAPLSSIPYNLNELIKNKIRIVLFSKYDLCDKLKTQRIIQSKFVGIKCFCKNIVNSSSCKDLFDHLTTIVTPNDERFLKLGFPIQPKRFIVLGIPNVGKSSLINSISQKKKTQVEDKPGKTKNEQLVKVNDNLFIFDTPGILAPNYNDKNISAKLAVLGCIKQTDSQLINLSDYLLDLIKLKYSNYIKKYFAVDNIESNELLFNALCEKRKFITTSNTPDIERARLTFMVEYRKGIIGEITLDE